MEFDTARGRVSPVDETARRQALDLADRLTKPRGALGQVEDVGAQLSAISGEVPPPVPTPAMIAVFAGDHGVVSRGVTPWPQEVTAQMVANIATGGAAINVLARQAGAALAVIDVGVACAYDIAASAPGVSVVDANVARGTHDIAVADAMSREDCRRALDVGASVAERCVASGARCLVTGEMGIGNTTPAAALVAAFTGRPPGDVTGRGTGIDDLTLSSKIAVVAAALDRAREPVARAATDPTGGLAAVGGLEIAALTGFIVGAAAARVPVVVDGLIALAALLPAVAFAPAVAGFVIAGHRSVEPGATAALDHLGLEPVLDLRLRLGEGTGACLALPVVEAGARILREMATFDSAGVSGKS